MLQFITAPGVGTLTPVEQARAAIEAGCRWIEINMPGATDNEVRNAAMELIRECEETNTFLIIRGHIDVVEELKVSGIHLPTLDEATAARERLGAHAIIGVDCNTADEAIELKHRDLDYAFLPVSVPDELAAIVASLSEAEVQEPVVAGAGVTLDNIDQIVETGVHGVAVSESVAGAPDPMLYMGRLLEKIYPKAVDDMPPA